jgi:hypothetical protein
MTDIKVPGVNTPNVPPEGSQGKAQKTSPMPGVILPGAVKTENIDDRQKKPFSMKDFRVRIRHFCISSGTCEDLAKMEKLLDQCLHSDISRRYLIERKDSFTKDGELISIFIYLEPKDAPRLESEDTDQELAGL